MVYLKIHHPSGFYKVIGVRLVHSYFKLFMLNIILVRQRDLNYNINKLFINSFIFVILKHTPKYTPNLHKSKF